MKQAFFSIHSLQSQSWRFRSKAAVLSGQTSALQSMGVKGTGPKAHNCVGLCLKLIRANHRATDDCQKSKLRVLQPGPRTVSLKPARHS